MDCSATSALKAQKVTEWAFPRETEGIVKTWLLSFSLLIHCDLTESREIFHLYSIRCTRSSFCMHANNFHSWSFFGIFSMYKQLAKSGACAAYWHPNSYCHSLHFEFLPDISKRLHMPNSPNAANAMTDPATCHANFLLWNSPKHSSNYVELTVTHGNMLISNFAAASNHFTMFKSNITLYHFVSLSWEIPESPNWVVGPARGLAKEAAPQLAKITKKKMCTNSDDSCDLCGMQQKTTTSLPWSSDFGHQPRDPLTTGGWSALHSQPRNWITRSCACSKKNLQRRQHYRNLQNAEPCPSHFPKVPWFIQYSIHQFAMRMTRLKQLGFLYGFSSTGTGPTPLNGNLFWPKHPGS